MFPVQQLIFVFEFPCYGLFNTNGVFIIYESDTSYFDGQWHEDTAFLLGSTRGRLFGECRQRKELLITEAMNPPGWFTRWVLCERHMNPTAKCQNSVFSW